ncbi:MAG: type II toxin-antitoxin system VapC family toxin [Deltaproteobacteria bacterium]|nr:type II toxin-antitoxin system VapC family toxin [Deltaproteobacteria bacterium]
MAKKTSQKAYVDSSAFISFLDRSDTYHSLFYSLFSDPVFLITTSLVISETHAWFLKRYDHQRALQFLNFIEDLKPLHILTVGTKELQQAKVFIKKFSDQNLTLVDACGLWVMKSEKNVECWSTDRHLGLTGIPLAIYL